MTKAHLEQRLKDLQDNLKLMQSLRDDLMSESDLLKLLNDRIEDRSLQILICQNNILHEPIQFDVKELEARI